MHQYAMTFEPVRSRRRDPETSKEAASKAREFAAGHFAKIVEALRVPGSYREIAARAELEPVAVARRMRELEQAGLVKRAGEVAGFTVWERA